MFNRCSTVMCCVVTALIQRHPNNPSSASIFNICFKDKERVQETSRLFSSFRKVTDTFYEIKAAAFMLMFFLSCRTETWNIPVNKTCICASCPSCASVVQIIFPDTWHFSVFLNSPPAPSVWHIFTQVHFGWETLNLFSVMNLNPLWY